MVFQVLKCFCLGFLPCGRWEIGTRKTKKLCKKKATPNWATLTKKALHTALVNIIGQLCMSLLFCFEPYFVCVFFS